MSGRTAGLHAARASVSATAALVFALGSLGSCGDSASDPDSGVVDDDGDVTSDLVVCENRSGTRLKEIFFEPEPERRQARGIFDAELETRCAPAIYADGVARCYPSDAGGALYFLDAACSQAVIAFSAGEVSAFYGHLTSTNDGCGLVAEYRTIGLPVIVDAGSPVFVDGAGGCTQTTAPARDYYQGGAVLAPSAFATLTTASQPEGTRLSMRSFRGPDDSAFCDVGPELYDTARSESCRLTADVNGELRCMPMAPSPQTFLSDDTCTTETTAVRHSTLCESPAPAYARASVGEGCTAGTRLTALAGELEVQRYTTDGMVCTPVLEIETTYYALGAEIDPTELVALGEEIEPGAGRLQRIVLAADDGFARPTTLWHDSRLDARCEVATATDGTTRCLPLGPPPQSFFGDAACTQPISVVVVGPCASEPSHAREHVDDGVRIHQLGAAAGTLHEKAGEECVVYDPGDSLVFEVGFELAPTSFVELTETIDP